MATRTGAPLVDLEISNPVPPDGLAGHTAQVLLRLHGRPLGLVPAPIAAGRIDLDALIPSVLTAHGGSLAAPLVERAIAIGTPPKWPEVASLLACRPNTLPCAPAVTVIVRTSGSARGRLGACLEAVRAMDYPSVSVIVADASTDAAILLAQAGGHVVAIIDDSVVVDRGWVGSRYITLD